jgi:membrane associated rhomboid family serine protease
MSAWTEAGSQTPRTGGDTSGPTAEASVSVGGVPWLTLVLLLACVWVLAAAGGLRAGLSVTSLLSFGAKATPLILDRGETWRFFTANLLHKDLLHFAFNAFAIWNVGGPLERAVRPADYCALLLATALGTTLASAIGGDSISLGASGMAFGVLGAAAAFGWRHSLRGPLKAHFGLRLLPWLAALFAAGLGSPGVDNWGHAGGLLSGAALGFFVSPRTAPPEASLRRLAAALGCVVIALALGAFAAPSLPMLGPLREGPGGAQLRFPIGWRRADAGPERLSYTNGLTGSFRSSATLWSSSGPASSVLCRPGGRSCSCARADALVRALVETDLYRLADVGALRGVELSPPEPWLSEGAPPRTAANIGRQATELRGAAQGSNGETQIAAVCTLREGAPLAVVVFMPPGSGEAAARLARRMAAAVSSAGIVEDALELP